MTSRLLPIWRVPHSNFGLPLRVLTRYSEQMKNFLPAVLALALLSVSAHAATRADEAAFVATYKKALEAGDAKTLEGFLYTKGAPPQIAEFFRMMVTMPIPPGSKVTSVELVTPTADEAAKLNTPKSMPDGNTYKLPLAPYKQIVITVESKDGSSSGTGTSKLPVAEKDGKLVIPVPVPEK